MSRNRVGKIGPPEKGEVLNDAVPQAGGRDTTNFAMMIAQLAGDMNNVEDRRGEPIPPEYNEYVSVQNEGLPPDNGRRKAQMYYEKKQNERMWDRIAPYATKEARAIDNKGMPPDMSVPARRAFWNEVLKRSGNR